MPYGSESSVALSARVNKMPFTIRLDSTAGPIVLYLETVHTFDLESNFNYSNSKPFGIANKPIFVFGSIRLTTDVGDDQML